MKPSFAASGNQPVGRRRGQPRRLCSSWLLCRSGFEVGARVIVGVAQAMLLAGMLWRSAWAAEPSSVPAEPPPATEPPAVAAAPAATTASPADRRESVADSRSFDRFRLIHERNIFNSERRTPLPPGRTPPPEPVRPPRTQSISLNGTICYESKAFAFLGSSESELRGIFSPGDQVGNLKLVSVDSHGIRLTEGDVSLNVPVGQGLQRSGDDPWRVSSVTSGAFASSNSSGRSRPAEAETPSRTNDTPAAAAGGGGGGDMSEIMRRMMERRRAQTGQ